MHTFIAVVTNLGLALMDIALVVFNHSISKAVLLLYCVWKVQLHMPLLVVLGALWGSRVE